MQNALASPGLAPGLSLRGHVVRAPVGSSRVAPAARHFKCGFKSRHAPFLQARKATKGRSRQQVKTSAVFDYCSTARGNTFMSSFRGTKALLMQLLRSNVSPETRPEIFKALVCIAYL
ncbi:hypothetical protein WJX79_004920, partial [Trebouxia sp. C0005]